MASTIAANPTRGDGPRGGGDVLKSGMVSTISANPTRGDVSRVGEDVRSGMPLVSTTSKLDLAGVSRVEDVARSGMASSMSSDPNRIGDLDPRRDPDRAGDFDPIRDEGDDLRFIADDVVVLSLGCSSMISDPADLRGDFDPTPGDDDGL